LASSTRTTGFYGSARGEEVPDHGHRVGAAGARGLFDGLTCVEGESGLGGVDLGDTSPDVHLERLGRGLSMLLLQLLASVGPAESADVDAAYLGALGYGAAGEEESGEVEATGAGNHRAASGCGGMYSAHESPWRRSGWDLEKVARCHLIGQLGCTAGDCTTPLGDYWFALPGRRLEVAGCRGVLSRLQQAL